MNDNEVVEIVKKLDWHLPDSEQQEALMALAKIQPSECGLLIQPTLKSTWHNAVLFIESLGYPKNEKSLPGLVWLLQDQNWPGASRAISILKGLETHVLVPLLETSIKEAYNCKDFMWLAGIKALILQTEVTENDFQNAAVYDLLEFADC